MGQTRYPTAAHKLSRPAKVVPRKSRFASRRRALLQESSNSIKPRTLSQLSASSAQALGNAKCFGGGDATSCSGKERRWSLEVQYSGTPPGQNPHPSDISLDGLSCSLSFAPASGRGLCFSYRDTSTHNTARVPGSKGSPIAPVSLHDLPTS